MTGFYMVRDFTGRIFEQTIVTFGFCWDITRLQTCEQHFISSRFWLASLYLSYKYYVNNVAMSTLINKLIVMITHTGIFPSTFVYHRFAEGLSFSKFSWGSRGCCKPPGRVQWQSPWKLWLFWLNWGLETCK